MRQIKQKRAQILVKSKQNAEAKENLIFEVQKGSKLYKADPEDVFTKQNSIFLQY